jgi:hypothetical protein
MSHALTVEPAADVVTQLQDPCILVNEKSILFLQMNDPITAFIERNEAQGKEGAMFQGAIKESDRQIKHRVVGHEVYTTRLPRHHSATSVPHCCCTLFGLTLPSEPASYSEWFNKMVLGNKLERSAFYAAF